MRVKLLLLAAIAVIALAHCGSMSSTQGTNVSDEQIASFTKGKTTRAEVVSALGGAQDTRFEGGKQILIYKYQKTCAYCSGDEAFTTTFIFNDKGVLEEVTKSRDIPQDHHRQ